MIALILPGLGIGLGSCCIFEQQTEIAAPGVVMAAPPLIEATLAGNVDDVRSQLANGTDPNLIYNTNTALTYAARDGFTEIARLLIDHGAEVNWIDGEGVTPLILASFKDHIELVQLLLAHGADITIRDQMGPDCAGLCPTAGRVRPHSAAPKIFKLKYMPLLI